jgi:hypothetical protein
MARKKTSSEYAVCCDHQRRTCLKLAEDAELIAYVPLDVENGLQVQQTSVESFNQRFKMMPGYPVERGCQLYLNYALAIGASNEALDLLGQIINISKEDREMATTKHKARAAAAAAPKKKAVPKKAPVKKKAAAAKPAGQSPKRPAAKKNSTKSGGAYSSAAQMFKALIMAGKLTDDEIFAAVQAEFSLDDKKRGYVKWYRNNLIKQGENPPAAK